MASSPDGDQFHVDRPGSIASLRQAKLFDSWYRFRRYPTSGRRSACLQTSRFGVQQRTAKACRMLFAQSLRQMRQLIPNRDLPRILRLGDNATGTAVLSDLYDRWKDTPVTVDLDQLWRKLGVHIEPRGIGIDPGAPLAEIRNSITARPSR